MKELKRYGITLFLLLLLFFAAGQRPVSAQESDDSEGEYQQIFDELLQESDADRLFGQLPEDTQKLLEKNGIDGVDSQSVLELDFWDILKGGWASLTSAASQPVRTLAVTVGIILLCALLNSMKSSFQNQTFERMFSVVSVICVSSALISPIARMIRDTAGLLKEMSDFLMGFIPVYVGIVTASGKPVSAMTCSAALIGVMQVISRLAATVLVPLLAVYMAICLIGAACQEIDMSGISRMIKNVVVVTLTFLMTVFVGLLSLQGTIASSADTVTVKTAKFAISTFVPVVGGAISEAFNMVQGGLGVIRSAVGAFGIISIAAAFLPPALSILLMQGALAIAGGVSDALEVKQVGTLMKSAASVLSLLLSILLLFAVLFILSVSVMMALSGVSAG